MAQRLWVERHSDGSWHAYNDEGAHITFGKEKGQFTPGDLMKIALAGCSALTSSYAIEKALGENHGATIIVDGTHNTIDNEYVNFSEQIQVDATEANLSDEEAQKLEETITRHIAKGCTVQRTYEQATPVRKSITIKR
ncbi:MAG: OsmC family protein [Bifidobacteriaceae bacterium]|nr:OsmC family protein [Bifidobacteriaceae bacterium]